mmetsp:Transcript_46810/g.87183  ORF Transcript_46810/g.87183 Transcript_46810/m.87183 type:complete len:220 (-) Transcript_46810:469-1128(-)
MEELPCAMLAKGPACTSTGVPSNVCMRVGLRASFIITVSAPPMPRSSAVTGSPALLVPTTMRPRRSRMSLREVARASTAMISLATAMSNPVSLDRPFSATPWPTVMLRRYRSLVSTTRLHVIFSGSRSRRANFTFSSSVSSSGSVLVMPSFFRRRNITGANSRLPFLSAGHRRLKRFSSFWVASWKTRVSMAAASRLLAAVMAWMSPVMCRLNSSMGIT